MVNKHLSDEEIQLFAINRSAAGASVAGHIHVCEECKAKVEVYRALITGVKQQPHPSFDFNLSAAVLDQLPVPQQKTANDKLLTWILVFVSIGALATATYYLRSYMVNMFQGVATILIYLTVISAFTVIAVTFFDMYKKFRREMKVLDAN